MSFKEKSAGYLANHMSRLFAQGLADRIKSLGIAPAQFVALLELWDEDGITQRQLVDRLDVEQATMANTISRMERDGLVVRKSHPEDARSKSIYLTNKAKGLREDALSSAQEVNEKALHGLSKEQRLAFLGTIQTIISNMRQIR
jgi:DNA-binding MarR family transcriptional regulator